MLHMNYYYYYDGRRGSCHWHRARDRDYTARAYMLAREPGWAHFARLCGVIALGQVIHGNHNPPDSVGISY